MRGKKNKVNVGNIQAELTTPLRNKNREVILKSLKKKDNMSISELWKKLGRKNFLSYKSFYNHIKTLEAGGYVRLEKDFRASGQAVNIKYMSDMEDLSKHFEETLVYLQKMEKDEIVLIKKIG